MGNIDTPDSIGALPRSRTELIPAAQSVGIYSGATPLNVPVPPETNGYTQLGAALSHFAGTTGVAVAHKAIELDDKKQTAYGEESAQRAAMDKSVKGVNDAVASGHLDQGASPTAMLAFQSNFAKLRAEQEAIALRQAYYANGELRNSTDSNAFQEWMQPQLQNSIKTITQDEHNNSRFSDLELSKSRFHDILQNAAKGLEVEHIAHRVSENKQMFRSNASTLAATGLEAQLGTGKTLVPQYLRNMQGLADAVSKPYFDPDSGQRALGGMPADDASDDMHAAIIQKALAEKDVTLLQIADHVKTPGGLLSDSLKWKTKAEAARRDIAGETDKERRNQEHWMMVDTHGSIEERKAAETDKFKLDQSEIQKRKLMSPLVDMLVATYKEGQQPSKENLAIRKQVYEEMFKTDPDKALHYSATISKLETGSRDSDRKEHEPKYEVQLRNAIGAKPGDSRVMAAVDQAYKDHRIDEASWVRLRTFGESYTRDSDTHAKLLNDDAFKSMESNLKAAIKGSPDDLFGATALNAMAANIDLRQLAIKTQLDNPKLSPLQIVAAMQPHVVDIAANYNGKVKEAIEEGKKTRKEQEEYQKWVESLKTPEVKAQVKAAEDQTKLIAEMDKAGKPVNEKTLAAEKAKKKPDTTNLKAAKTEMSLTPQEENLYNHHLRNLHGDGKVINTDKSISTIRQSTFTQDGKTYNVPTIWDGKELKPDDAWKKAKGIGLDKFPSYDSVNKAESRYQRMHAYMDKDTQAYQSK